MEQILSGRMIYDSYIYKWLTIFYPSPTHAPQNGERVNGLGID